MNSQTEIKKIWTAGSLAVFAILLFFFYPPVYAIRDEGIYLAMTSLFRHGTFHVEKTSVPLMMVADVMGHRVPLYPPGNAFLLFPFTLLGWPAVFLSGFVMHLAGAYFYRRLSQHFEADTRIGIILYFMFPAFVFYSRTIMSDMPSLAIFMAACFFYFDSKYPRWLSGVLFGLNLLFRVSNVVLALPFGLIMLWNALRHGKGRELLGFCAGAAPFAALMLICNWALFGSPFLSGYAQSLSGVRNFGLDFLAGNLVHYLVSLNVMYPLMLVVFLFNRKTRRLEIFLLLAALLAFFGFYYFHDTFPGRAATWIFGTRFLFPVIPFLIMAYGDFLDRLLARLSDFMQEIVVAFIVISLWACAVFITVKHQDMLKDQESLKKMVYSSTHEDETVLFDSGASELLQELWGKRDYVPEDMIVPEKIETGLAAGEAIFWMERTGESVPALKAWDKPALSGLKARLQFILRAESRGLRIFQLLPLKEEAPK